MEFSNIILFDGKVPHIVKEGEILYSMEGLLKYFSLQIVHIDPLINNIKRTYPCLEFKKFNSSSYYLNTSNALKFLMYINSKETNRYKDWIVKCAIERINEILCPMIMYDRLKTILYKKGIRINYSFMKKELDLLSKRVNYIQLDQQILNDDIKSNTIDLKLINNPKINVVKLPRSKANKTTNIL